MEGSEQLHIPFAIADRWIGNGDPTTDLDVLEKNKFVFASHESKRDCTVVHPITMSVPTELFWLRYPTVRSLNEVQYSVKSRQHNFAFVM